MENFEFLCPTKVIFGKDSEQKAGTEVKKYSNKVLLHYGKGSVIATGLFDKIAKSLEEAGVDYIPFGGALPNPRLSLVNEGINICRENKIGFILAVGGGSVIDSAKAIAVGAPYDGDVWDFFLEKTSPEEAIPLGAVLTLAGTGSEVSWSTVITNEQTNLKRHLDHNLIIPKFAIMNPDLTMTLPAYQTACGITDIMAHTMERYFTQVKDVEFTDRLCEATLKTLINVADVIMKEPDNYAARAEIMWAGSIAHNNLLGTGRIGDWASHMIEHEISAINDIAHGAGLAIIFPAWMKYVYKYNIDRFVQYAVRVWGVEESFGNPEKTINRAIMKQISFYKSLGLPVSLNEVGISRSEFENIAEKCRKFDQVNETVGNFVKLTKEDIVNILELAF